MKYSTKLGLIGTTLLSFFTSFAYAGVNKDKLYTEGTQKQHNVVVIPEVEVKKDGVDFDLGVSERLESLVLEPDECMNFETKETVFGNGAEKELSADEKKELSNLPVEYYLLRFNGDEPSKEVIKIGKDYEICYDELEPGRYKLIGGASHDGQQVASVVGDFFVVDKRSEESENVVIKDKKREENSFYIFNETGSGDTYIVTSDGAKLLNITTERVKKEEIKEETIQEKEEEDSIKKIKTRISAGYVPGDQFATLDFVYNISENFGLGTGYGRSFADFSSDISTIVGDDNPEGGHSEWYTNRETKSIEEVHVNASLNKSNFTLTGKLGYVSERVSETEGVKQIDKTGNTIGYDENPSEDVTNSSTLYGLEAGLNFGKFYIGGFWTSDDIKGNNYGVNVGVNLVEIIKEDDKE